MKKKQQTKHSIFENAHDHKTTMTNDLIVQRMFLHTKRKHIDIEINNHFALILQTATKGKYHTKKHASHINPA